MTLCLSPPRRAGAAGAAPLRPAPQQPACALRDGARPQKSAPSQLEPVRTPLSLEKVGCPGGLQPGEGAGEGAGEQPPRQGMEQPQEDGGSEAGRQRLLYLAAGIRAGPEASSLSLSSPFLGAQTLRLAAFEMLSSGVPQYLP